MMEQDFLDAFVEQTMEHLGANLAGIYLHGSMAMNSYVPGKSDVDLLIVIHHHDWPEPQKRLLVKEYMKLENRFFPVKIEMSVVLKESIEHFSHPSPFVLHYSNEHKERYVSNPDYLCGNDLDPDLAAHYMITIERGICLHGESIKSLFRPVPKEAYLDSILSDVEDAKEKIDQKPVYYILNLCRVLYYIEEGIISSKKEAGVWAVRRLSEDRSLVEAALLSYSGEDSNPFDLESLQYFAVKMLGMITN